MTQIMLIGEAWGADEERRREPFVGTSGQELTRMLKDAEINRSDCYLTNVFNLRPEHNDLSTLCGSDRSLGLPPLTKGKYLSPLYSGELDRLFAEIRSVGPNICVCLGNTPTWALLRSSGIRKIRGTVGWSDVGGVKCLSTYHPAAVIRDWTLRAVTVLDLRKARRESEFPEIRRPHRLIYIEPSLEDLEDFYQEYLIGAPRIAFDIETFQDQITCIGFAPSSRIAIVVPFVDPRCSGSSYWSSTDVEVAAWRWVSRVLSLPCPKAAHNGLYDIHFLWRSYGIDVTNFEDDTMLLHHALQPESEKSLGYLGSIYTDEASWKMMRARGKTTIKQDE